MNARSSAMIWRAARPALLLALLFNLGGCAVIKGIFKAGMGVGIALTVGAVMLAGALVALVIRKPS